MIKRMRELSLFSGAGLGLLGTHHLLGWRTVGYVEINNYCQRVLAQRIKDGHLDEAPIFSDIRSFISEGYAESYKGLVDVITGGFPCQPFSVAGKRDGELDPRNMWPETIRTICCVRPRYCFLENVPGLLAGSHGYFGRILRELADCGYDARWTVLSASECGAPHLRKRLWVVASQSAVPDTKRAGVWEQRERCGQQRIEQGPSFTGDNGAAGNVADSNCGRQQGEREQKHAEQQGSRRCEPDGRSKGRRGERATMADSSSNRRKAPSTDSNGHNEGARGKRSRKLRGSCFRSPGWWEAEPDVGRVADGVSSRVDRLRAIGNGQVPAVAALAWEVLTS